MRREELRIIDQDTWDAVQERLQSIKSKYARDPEQRVAGRAHGASSLYPLSGLLFCDACSSPMSIGGGAKDRRYYICASSRNGRCAVDASVRVDVVQRCVLEALRDRLLSGGVDEIRKQLARRMGEIGRNQNAEAKAARDWLQQAEARVANLVNVFASGERSAALSQALKDAEATVAEERRSLAELERLATRPVRLLSPAEVQERLHQIDELVLSSPIEAREHLRRIFASGKIRLRWHADGYFIARAEILGEILVVETRTPAAGFSPGREFTYGSSGGRI